MTEIEARAREMALRLMAQLRGLLDEVLEKDPVPPHEGAIHAFAAAAGALHRYGVPQEDRAFIQMAVMQWALYGPGGPLEAGKQGCAPPAAGEQWLSSSEVKTALNWAYRLLESVGKSRSVAEVYDLQRRASDWVEKNGHLGRAAGVPAATDGPVADLDLIRQNVGVALGREFPSAAEAVQALIEDRERMQRAGGEG